MSNSTLTPNAGTDEWSQTADKAREAGACVCEMATHAASAVGALASQAAADVSRKADELTASTGAGIQELSDRLRRNAPQTGVLGSASEAVAGDVKGGGEYLENAKLSGMTEDLAQVIRRNPIPAVLVALGLGWFVGRKLKD